MGEGSMKKDKKEYCLTQKEVIEIINREREGVDKDYLIRNAIDYLISLDCTPEKYKEFYEDITS